MQDSQTFLESLYFLVKSGLGTLIVSAFVSVLVILFRLSQRRIVDELRQGRKQQEQFIGSLRELFEEKMKHFDEKIIRHESSIDELYNRSKDQCTAVSVIGKQVEIIERNCEQHKK